MDRWELLSLTMALGGLAGLGLLSQGDIDRTPIGTLGTEHMGQGVKVCGTLVDVRMSAQHHTFFTINDDSGSMRGVVFNSTVVALPDEGCLIGRVDVWKGDLELIVEGVVDSTSFFS